MMRRTSDDKAAMGNSRDLTRRGLFQRAGLTLATSVFSPALASALAPAQASHREAASAALVESPATPVMERLSKHMGEASSRALPDDVVERAKEHILDTLAAMVSGADLLPGRSAIEFVRAYGGEKAALANGMLAHSDETDDEAPLGVHSGCAVIPATLAVGEQLGIDGMHFIRA